MSVHPKFRDTKRQSVSWASLESQVKKFVEAKTQGEKLKWLAGVGDGYPSDGTRRLVEIFLPASESVRRELITLAISAGNQGPLAPVVVVKRAAQFLDSWFRKQDIEGTVRNFISQDQIGTQHPGMSGDNLAKWSRRFMTLMLASDHGEMNALGHGDPSAAGYVRIPLGVSSGATVSFVPPKSRHLRSGWVLKTSPSPKLRYLFASKRTCSACLGG